MRRRSHLVRIKSEIQSHIAITNYQYNLEPFEKNIVHKANRAGGIADHFQNTSVRLNVETDIAGMDGLHDQIKRHMEKLTEKFGKGKTLSILAHKLGRAITSPNTASPISIPSFFFSLVLLILANHPS